MYGLRDTLRTAMCHWIDTNLEADDLVRVVVKRARGSSEVNAGCEYNAGELAAFASADALLSSIVACESVQAGGRHKLVAFHAPKEGDTKQRRGSEIAFTPKRATAAMTGRATGDGAAAEGLAHVLGGVASGSSTQAANMVQLVADGQREQTQLVIDLFERMNDQRGEKDAEIMRLNNELAQARLDLRFAEMEAKAKPAVPLAERLAMIDAIGSMAVNAGMNLLMAYRGAAQALPDAAPAGGAS